MTFLEDKFSPDSGECRYKNGSVKQLRKIDFSGIF